MLNVYFKRGRRSTTPMTAVPVHHPTSPTQHRGAGLGAEDWCEARRRSWPGGMRDASCSKAEIRGPQTRGRSRRKRRPRSQTSVDGPSTPTHQVGRPQPLGRRPQPPGVTARRTYDRAGVGFRSSSGDLARCSTGADWSGLWPSECRLVRSAPHSQGDITEDYRR